jgi:hypothetical protein
MARAMQSAMTATDEIRSKIEAFTADLTALVHQEALAAVRAALGEGLASAPSKPAGRPAATFKAATPKTAAPAKKPAAPKKAAPALAAKAAPAAKTPAKAATAPKAPAAAAKKAVAVKRPLGAKRPPAELAKLTEKLGEHIKANPGLGMEAIGKDLSTPTSELTLPIKKLLAAKRIRFEGVKRATRYFPA